MKTTNPDFKRQILGCY